jgi:hypothetical protein
MHRRPLTVRRSSLWCDILLVLLVLLRDDRRVAVSCSDTSA